MVLLHWLGFLWALPNTVLQLLLAIPYGAHNFEIDWKTATIVATVKRAAGNPGATTWSCLIYAVGEHNRKRLDDRGPLWRHEFWHTVQARVLSLLFMILYGIEFAVRFAFPPDTPQGKRWYRAYHALSWEKAARKRE